MDGCKVTVSRCYDIWICVTQTCYNPDNEAAGCYGTIHDSLQQAAHQGDHQNEAEERADNHYRSNNLEKSTSLDSQAVSHEGTIHVYYYTYFKTE